MSEEDMVESYKTYYVWVVSQNSDYAETLAAKLVRRGFTIGPLGRQLVTQHDDNPACVVAMSIYRTPRNEQERKDWTGLGIHQEVTDVIKTIKGKFWGLIVSAAADCSWNIGNISIKAEKAEVQEALKRVN